MGRPPGRETALLIVQHQGVGMARATQLNLRLTNEIGALATLCRDMAMSGVNLLALSLPASEEASGVVRLLVANPQLAEHALSEAGYSFEAEEVVFVELKNRPGALAKAVEKLAKGSINVRYAYATANTSDKKTAAVIAVDEEHLRRALKLLG